MGDNAILGEEQLAGSSLGYQVGDQYKIHEHTAEVLESINKRLNDDDKTLRPYRRALTFSQIIQKDLVPILISSSNETDIFDSVVRLMVNITLPVECLFPMEVVGNSEAGKEAIFELNHSLRRTKELYRDSRTTRPIMERLCLIVSKHIESSSAEVMTANNCLLLLRNILHIPVVDTNSTRNGKCSIQNQIMWNLFSQNLDNVLLDLICHNLSRHWSPTIVQLIALVYKDQHVVTLQRLLQNFLESSMSDSSEDNESNTSPQEMNGSCSSDLRSLEHSDDSSDNGGCRSSPDANRMSPNKNENKKQSNKRCHINDDETSGIEDMLTNASKNKETSEDSVQEKEEEEPPKKKHITENRMGNPSPQNLPSGRSSPHSQRKGVDSDHSSPSSTSDEAAEVDGRKDPSSESDSSGVTGVPKGSKGSKFARASGNISDYGYVSQQTMESENQESVSTSSNEEVHGKHKPHTNLSKPRPKKATLTLEEKKEKRRLTLLKRSKANRLKVKAMVNHIPTDEDISELLKEFTVDFLLKGYSDLVSDILQQLVNETGLQMDKSHFLWLITYFLKFTGQLELDLAQMNSVLSFQMLSYLTFVGVEQLELLELAQRDRRGDFTPHLRRMHLVVTALREFIQTLDLYESIPSLTVSDKKKIRTLHLQACYTREIRQLILLLLRRYKPVVQPIQYLSDLVVSNHILLMKLEEVKGCEEYIGPPFDMTEHVRQFANTELMRQYGRLLDDFADNPPQVNDCIFTIMHHIAGDLNSPETLCMPSILKTFSRIWEQGKEVCDEWTDLIEYVIQKFIQTMGSRPHSAAANMVECLDPPAIVDDYGFSPTQANSLRHHYTQVNNSKDPVGAIIEIYRQTDNITLPRVAIIQELLSQGIITHAQYMNLMYMKSMMSPYQRVEEGSVIAEIGSEHCESDKDVPPVEKICENQGGTDTKDTEIQLLTDCLHKQGRGGLLTWLQSSLLDACRVKIFPNSIILSGSAIPHEPVPFYYHLTKQSIPLVPWSRTLDQGLQTEAFILLLHKLGFHLPADIGKLFPRIPHFWSADYMYGLASKLGPIQDNHRFTIEDLETSKPPVSAAPTLPSSSPQPGISSMPGINSISEIKDRSRDNTMGEDLMMSDSMMDDMMGDNMMDDDMMMDPMGEGCSLSLLPKPSFSWQHLAFTSKQMGGNNSPGNNSPPRSPSSESDSELMTDLEGLHFTS